MAPRAASSIISPISVKEMTLECSEAKQKEVSILPQNTGEINERSRKVLKKCLGNLRSTLNVLVTGANESGKSSLINSLNMALTQEWCDRARYCPGRTHIVDPCVMYKGAKSPDRGRVVFWDTRGFEKIHDEEHAVLILRYVIEGRIPPKCIPCVLLMSKELIKKRYRKVAGAARRIDLILHVSSICDEPSTSLMRLVQEAVSTSKVSAVNRIPMVSVVTKSDLLTSEEKEEKLKRLSEYDLEKFVEKQRQSKHAASRRKHRGAPDARPNTKLVVNYCCELEPWSDESINPTDMKPSDILDANLLGLWREIISRTAPGGIPDGRGPPCPKVMFGCLPISLKYSRIRSHSL